MISEGDKNLIIYFLEEFDSLDRMGSWERIRGEALEEFPVLRIALRMQREADEMMKCAIESIKDSPDAELPD